LEMDQVKNNIIIIIIIINNINKINICLKKIHVTRLTHSGSQHRDFQPPQTFEYPQKLGISH
jgi:hypothetical protein